MKAILYLYSGSDGSYYVGVTSDLEGRMVKYNTGFYEGSYTSSWRPLELVFLLYRY